MDSPRCSKALREKMQETPDFATDFAKMSLLANVGRVNTTMTCLFFSFYVFRPPFLRRVDPDVQSHTVLPEMRTALRTYHPVPSLQKADANLQDAPRIKNILKACSLKNEASTNMPVTPSELRTRAVSTQSHIHIPPTSHLILIDYLPTGIWRRPLYQHRQSSFRPLQSLHRPSIKTLFSFVVFTHSPAVSDRGT